MSFHSDVEIAKLWEAIEILKTVGDNLVQAIKELEEKVNEANKEIMNLWDELDKNSEMYP